jgi:protein tyrosine/serine phosphatase
MEWVNVPLLDYPSKLYLGNAETAVNYKFLEEKEIKYMISLDDSNEEDRLAFAKIYGIHLYFKYFEDNASSQYEIKVRYISQDVAQTIHGCLQKGNTYIHCQAGINRSPLCVAKFLINYQTKKPQEAIDLLKTLNKKYRKLPCLYNPLFVKILGGTNDQIDKFVMFRSN